MALRVASSATPAEPGPVDIRSDRKVEFRRKAARLGTTNPVIKAALVRLRDVWPASIPVPELASSALAIASGRPVVTNTDILTPQSRNLVDALLRAFGTGLVDLHTVAPAFQVTLTDRPTASPLARWQAVAGSSVTNGLHETVSLNDLQRQVLLGLDGTRNREELTQFVAQRVAEGYLILMAQTGRVETAEAAGAILREQVPQAVEFLARAALLVG
jgi:methyltransferase-like protein